MVYSFDGATLPLVNTAINPLASRIPAAETPARAGGYNGRRKTGSRTISVMGTMKAASYALLLAAWSAFEAVHDVDTPRPLSIRDGWFYYAIPDSVTPSDQKATNLHYQIDYKVADPFCYSTALSTHALNTSGSVDLSVAGNRPARPTLTLVVSAPGGAITITNTTTGQTCYLYPTAAQTYTINCRTEKMETGAMVDFSGVWLTLAPNAVNSISITTASGAALSSAQIAWRDTEL